MEITKEYLQEKLLYRKDDSHKREYGHVLLFCGCESMPEVSGRFSCVGAGPGLGRHESTAEALRALMADCADAGIPMVLDADALNFIAADACLADLVPEGSVLTPHLGELGRLLPGFTDQAIADFCRKHHCTLVKKGFRTTVFSPEGERFTNTTGNPGMAKGGSGDVLTGLISGLFARGYDGLTAALLGVWIHGYAGDRLTAERTSEAYSSYDIIDFIHKGFKQLY